MVRHWSVFPFPKKTASSTENPGPLTAQVEIGGIAARTHDVRPGSAMTCRAEQRVEQARESGVEVVAAQ
jgi:hypothetical protein